MSDDDGEKQKNKEKSNELRLLGRRKEEKCVEYKDYLLNMI